ncbi:hypothetical protein F5879DRAFT_189175 [Lentinula edodes]|nr:hypothetical protein F5879DRAFT_189175 [Lentinula edodes]
MDLDLISDATEVRDTNYVAFVGFTIMIWDHLDTFTTEVEYVWPRVGEKKPSQEYPFPHKTRTDTILS